MKKFVLLSAVSVALALAAGKAVAQSDDGGPFAITISGTVETVKTNINDVVQTTQTKSFNNATIYLAISNAVALGNADIAPTNLPAKGLIVYDPGAFDGMIQGVFFVTAKGSTNFFPLSGIDNAGNYYSFMELDTDNANTGVLGFDLGVNDDFNTVASFNASSEKASSTAVFYIHDDPYAYDAADFWAWLDGFGNSGPKLSNPNPTASNTAFSLEMQGILIATSTAKSGSGSFSGTGNALLGGNEGLVTSGKLSVK